ncbi:TetR/AcrR family transcriptional regulator [Robbsia sp. KACC 23696]|uniref:TetR/AcrR family transcriptional regulator n=1 Tax=Robbsia sp. KACC 23696 TaxID=3149231 RepID=UPI00325B5326
MNKKPNPRLSREESRAVTRERLLAAAGVLIERQGLASASVEDVVAEAGYSRGAFYSNFEDKAALLLALLALEQRRLIDDLGEVFSADLAPSDLEQAVLAYYRNLHRNRICFLAGMEAKLLAIRDLAFRDKLRDLTAEGHGLIAGFVDAYRQRVGIHPSGRMSDTASDGLTHPHGAAPVAVLPAEQLAIGLIAMCEGIHFTHLADPESVDDAMVTAVLSQYFNSLLGRRAA